MLSKLLKINTKHMNRKFKIAGAGIAGLSAGIQLAKSGFDVEIFEHHPSAGHRFHNGFQILENYHSKIDAIDWMEEAGFTLDFFCRPQKNVRFFDKRHLGIDMKSRGVYGYFIKRGPGPDTLDSALVRQAESLGVTIHYRYRIPPEDADIIATGARGTAGIGREVVFETDLSDTFWVILDNSLTPSGFSYLFVIDGLGTIGAAILKNFSRMDEYFDKTVSAYRKIRRFAIKNPQYGTSQVGFFMPHSAKSGHRLYVGEAAGFQDFLFGLGIRRSLHSGFLAAQSITDHTDYDELWKREFGNLLKASVVNRFLFELAGNAGFRVFIKEARKRDFRAFGFNMHQYTIERRILFPIVTKIFWRKPKRCPHGPRCSWCKPVSKRKRKMA